MHIYTSDIEPETTFLQLFCIIKIQVYTINSKV